MEYFCINTHNIILKKKEKKPLSSKFIWVHITFAFYELVLNTKAKIIIILLLLISMFEISSIINV